MGHYSLIRPEEDNAAKQASSWATTLNNELGSRAHTINDDIDELSPADRPTIENAVSKSIDLVCYFGHGTKDAWTTSGLPTIDSRNASKLSSKVIVSIACKTGRDLGPDAILAGATAWIGFNISVPTVRPYRGFDPIGDAIVEGILEFHGGGTVQDVADAIVANLDQVVTDHDNGRYQHYPNATIVYFSALALMHHVVALGSAGATPL